MTRAMILSCLFPHHPREMIHWRRAKPAGNGLHGTEGKASHATKERTASL